MIPCSSPYLIFSSIQHQVALRFPSLPCMLFPFGWPPCQRSNITLVEVSQRAYNHLCVRDAWLFGYCLFVVCFITKSFLTYSFIPTPTLSTVCRPLSSYVCSIIPETANVDSSYSHMRGPGVGCWFSYRSNCSHWIFMKDESYVNLVWYMYLFLLNKLCLSLSLSLVPLTVYYMRWLVPGWLALVPESFHITMLGQLGQAHNQVRKRLYKFLFSLLLFAATHLE